MNVIRQNIPLNLKINYIVILDCFIETDLTQTLLNKSLALHNLSAYNIAWLTGWLWTLQVWCTMVQGWIKVTVLDLAPGHLHRECVALK